MLTTNANRRRCRRLLWLAAAGLFACSSNGNNATPDGGAQNDGTITEGGSGDATVVVDANKPDLPPANKPIIKQIIPSDGPADGGRKGSIPVTLVGENFTPTMTVYVDGGQVIITTIKYTSSVSVSFTLPKNPYGPPYDNPAKVSLMVRAGNVNSNSVDFQYTVTNPLTADATGAVITSSAKAFRDFSSEPYEAKIYIKDVTDTTTGAPANLTAEIGLGKVGEDPTQDYSFHWFPANFSKDDGNYDVFVGQVTPPLEQTYDVAFRFSNDGGQTYYYVDTNESDLAYAPADAAKLNVSAAPYGYCKVDQDCNNDKYRKVCNVDPSDWTKNRCVECKSSADCSANSSALGPNCETSKFICMCAADDECKTNPNGKACVSQGSYCGCTKDEDCDAAAGEKCAEDAINQIYTCVLP